MRVTRGLGLAGVLAALAIGGVGGMAQAAAPAPAVAQLPLSPTEIATMTRSALIALDQANKTGNYSVLRDLGSATFHANSDARLAEVFADLRRQNLDMSPVLSGALNFTTLPALDARGMLHLAGWAPLGARNLQFEMAWAQEGGTWRLYGIAVTATEPARP